jgi:hypothetical protein
MGRTRRAEQRWFGAALVLLGALAVGAVVAGSTLANHENDGAAHVPPDSYVPDSIPCEGPTVDANCVARAARRSGRTIAWLPDVGRTADRRLFVAPPPDEDGSPVAAGEILYATTLEDVSINLESAPAAFGPGDRRRAGVVRSGEISADAWRSDDGSSLRLEWTRADQDYRLQVFRVPTDEAEDDVTRVVEQALAAVTYAEAPGG